MQCIRGNNNHSPPLTPIESASMDSLNRYLANRLNRKSFVRRSFEFVRKNFVRQSQYLSPRNSYRTRGVTKRNEVNINDLNNNGSSYNNSPILPPITDQHSTYTHCSGEDVFVISADSDILPSNKTRKKQLFANLR